MVETAHLKTYNSLFTANRTGERVKCVISEIEVKIEIKNIKSKPKFK
jgi:hypothetical protein